MIKAVLAAHFLMTMVGPCGIRLVCLFLKLTGLDQVVATSYGSQQKLSVAMEEAIVKYGEEEKQRWAEIEAIGAANLPANNMKKIEKYRVAAPTAQGQSMKSTPVQCRAAA